MKVILSNKAFFEPDAVLKERVRTNLTYTVRAKNALQQYDETVHNFGAYIANRIWIPNTRLDLLYGYDYTVIDKRITKKFKMPKLRTTLRDDQQEVVDQIDDSCIINASPGWGKSYAALGIIDKFQLKTLILCPNKSIMAMWEDTIIREYGFTPGRVTAGSFNTDRPITVANIQSAHLHAEKLANKFGLLIIDEMHHCTANTYRKFIFTSRARYKIGLSGTLSRPDGMDVSFKDYFGLKVFTPKNNNIMLPEGHIYTLDNIELSGCRRISWGSKISSLAYETDFPRYVTVLAKMYLTIGHKVLVVGDRVEMLKDLAEKLQLGLIIGDTPIEERNQILKKVTRGELQGICSTTSIFAEGISQNNLSCLVVATAIGNNAGLIEQVVGRIMRKHPDKLDPVIVDIALGGSLGERQKHNRENIYKEKRWPFEQMTVEKLYNRYLKGRV